MEKHDPKEMIAEELTAMTEDTALLIEMYLSGYKSGLIAASKAKTEEQTEKEPA